MRRVHSDSLKLKLKTSFENIWAWITEFTVTLQNASSARHFISFNYFVQQQQHYLHRAPTLFTNKSLCKQTCWKYFMMVVSQNESFNRSQRVLTISSYPPKTNILSPTMQAECPSRAPGTNPPTTT